MVCAMRHAISYILLCFTTLVSYGICHGQDEVLVDTLGEFRFVAKKDIRAKGLLSDSISELQLRESSTLTEVLATSSNLYVKDYGPGNIANVTLHGGTAQQVEVYWNGMAINSPSLGLMDISLLPTAFINGLWLDQGGTSILEGSGAATGALRMTSGASSDRNNIRLAHTLTPELGGSSSSAIISFKEKGLSSRTSLIHDKADNRYEYIDDSHAHPVSRKRENAEYTRYGLSEDIEWSLGEGLKFQLSTHAIASDRNIAGLVGVPSRGERQVDEIWRNTALLSKQGRSSLQELALGYVNEYQRYEDPLSEIDSRIHTSRLHMRYVHRRAITNKTHLKFRWDNDISRLKMQDVTSRELSEMGVYMGLENKLTDHTRVDLSIRQEWGNGPSDPLSYGLVIYQGFERVEELTITASFAHTFRNPTLNDLYWPELGVLDLDAERGFSAVLGSEWRGDKGWLGLEVFRSEINEMIRWLPNDHGVFRPVNQEQNRNLGATLKLGLHYGGLDSEASISRIQSRHLTESGDWSDNIYQPSWQCSARLSQQLQDWKVSALLRYSSQVFTDRTYSQSSTLPSVLWADLALSWQVPGNSGISLGLKAANVLNENYEYIKNRPGVNRHFLIQLNIAIHEQ
jgi:vitamin B12 transporter